MSDNDQALGHCQDCRWFVPRDPNKRNVGRCHGGPPTAVEGKDRAEWPTVGGNWWCAAFAQRDERKDEGGE